MKTKVTVEEWVAMFREIQLSDETMRQWHRVFEARHPEAHRAFLEWLGLPPARIEEIRTQSR